MTKLLSTKKYLVFIFGALLLLAASTLVFKAPEKQAEAATANAPTVHIQWGDATDSSPHHPGDCNTELNGGLGGDSPTATDSVDPDCLRVRITNDASTVYTDDFRFCLRYATTGVRACTGYASESGGWPRFSQMTSSNHNGNLSGTMVAEVDTRPMTCANGQQPPTCAGLPSGATISNVKVGVGLATQDSSSGQCYQINVPTAFKYGPVGGYWFSDSFWAFGAPDDDDPGCFQAGMSVSLNIPMNAQFVSTTIPNNLAPNTSYNGNYRITMKNTGQYWPLAEYSTQFGNVNIVRPATGCSTNPADYPPGQPQSCFDYQILSSQRFRMERIDGLSNVQVQSKQIRPGFNDITYSNGQYTYNGGLTTIPASTTTPTVETTIPFYIRQTVEFRHTIEPAYRECERDPDGGRPICTNYPETHYVEQIATPYPIINFNDNAILTPINLTIGSLPAGTHHIKFRMVDLDNLNSNTNGYTAGNFGDTVDLPITVAAATGPTLSCGVNQIVQQGQTANFPLAANNLPSGYNDNINMTMVSDPTGPAMTTSPVVLGPGNVPLPYHNIAQVPTGSLAPDTYNLTFTGNDSGGNVGFCYSSLTVEPSLHVDLRFNGQQGPTQPNPANGSTGQLSWEVWGATSCVAAMESGSDTTPAPAGPWTGAKSATTTNPPSAPLHTFDVSGMQAGTYVFRITCYDGTGEEDIDTVRVTVGSVQQPTLRFWCSGGNTSGGNTGGDDGGEPDTCHIPQNGSAMLFWDSQYTYECFMDPYLGYEIETVNLEGDSTGSLSTLGNHRYTATCPGAPGTQAAVKSVNIIVDPGAGGSGPTNPTAGLGACRTVEVSWDNPRGPAPIGFNVYSHLEGDKDWTQANGRMITYIDDTVITSDGGQTYRFTDTSPLEIGVSNYYAVEAVYGNGTRSRKEPTLPQSVVPEDCGGVDLSTSDKDIIRVVSPGVYNATFNPDLCSGETNPITLPGGALFSVGDKVTFEIHVCNSTDQVLNGITVTDTLERLSSPEGFNSSTGINGAPCMDRHAESGNTISIDLGPLQPRSSITGLPGICSIQFTATVANPSPGTAAGIYRFRNIGDIFLGANRWAHYETPYFSFNLKGGVPVRNETAPPRTGQ